MNSPFAMVIFGATGDLMQRKLLPSLFALYKQKKFGEKFYIVGFARRSFSDQQFREFLGGEKEFMKHFYYQQGQFDEVDGYNKLIEKLNSFDKEIGACITRLFYLATPPDHYQTILNFLQSTKLSEGCGQGSSKSRLPSLRSVVSGQGTRVIIEKPFGKDLETARMIDKKLSEIFEERQIFRVDHYLGKETVQNILAFRFANGIFDPIWNKNFLDHVQITWGEKAGVSDRGAFFDGVGMLRDVAQNHLLQFVASVAMEQPQSFTKESVRDARAKAIQAIRCPEPQDVLKVAVRGQYEGYREEKDVAKDSTTETFVAMKLFVDTPRFEGVPFYLRAGKKMPKDGVEINIVFIQTCHLLFKEYGCPEIGNVLTIKIQPDEGISLRVIAKKPGDKLALDTVNMNFTYQTEFGGKGSDAYEKILMDIFAGDQMLFNRSDELESSWQFIENILKGWSREAGSRSAGEMEKGSIPIYAPETWGPKQSFTLIEKDGKKWL